MISSVCCLLEALSVVICIHRLYGKKFKLDAATAGLLAVDVIMMQVIENLGLPKQTSVLIYLIIFLYCGIEFGFHLKPMIINNVLYMGLVSEIQLGVTWLYYLLAGTEHFESHKLIGINLIALLLVTVGLPKGGLKRLSIYLQNEERILMLSITASILMIGFCLVNYKVENTYSGRDYIFLFVIIAFLCILSAQLSKYKIKSSEIATELRMHKLYENSFQELIGNIRLRQHEFENHMNTIYSQHYVCHTYEELVEAQREYCQMLLEENRYNNLLTKGNPAIIGFLYGKFLEIERQGLGLNISYRVHIDKMETGIPVSRLVEILGDLINNAVEALALNQKERALFVSVLEESDYFEIEVRNKSPYIEYGELTAFFANGYSKKGENRGLGLYNVKRICDEYSMEVSCENKTIEEDNWLVFRIRGRKRQMDKKSKKDRGKRE